MKSIIFVTLLLVGVFFYAGCASDDDPNVPVPPEPELPEFVIPSSDYLNHRFFFLDLPMAEPDGRVYGESIVLNSINIFQLMPGGEPVPGDLVNVAVYVDSLGYRSWEDMDFVNPHTFGRRWREIYSWDPLLGVNENLIGVDLRIEMHDQDVLAIIYEVEQADGIIVQVGDFPGVDDPSQEVTNGDGEYYRMKLLKAPVSDQERHSFGYVIRNIYFLGSRDIYPFSFDLRIERNEPGTNQPQQDETGLDYIRIFGLDWSNPQRTTGPDGVVDFWDPYIFDLYRGLLKFPLDFPMPFAPGGGPIIDGNDADLIAESTYAAYADTSGFVWNPSFLRTNQTWQLYHPSIFPSQYSDFTSFKIIATYPGAPTELN